MRDYPLDDQRRAGLLARGRPCARLPIHTLPRQPGAG
jgi:hypothetical protein